MHVCVYTCKSVCINPHQLKNGTVCNHSIRKTNYLIWTNLMKVKFYNLHSSSKLISGAEESSATLGTLQLILYQLYLLVWQTNAQQSKQLNLHTRDLWQLMLCFKLPSLPKIFIKKICIRSQSLKHLHI